MRRDGRGLRLPRRCRGDHPQLLITAALGSILLGYATPTEAADCGAFGALPLTLAYRRMSVGRIYKALVKSREITVLITVIQLIGLVLVFSFRQIALWRPPAPMGTDLRRKGRAHLWSDMYPLPPENEGAPSQGAQAPQAR